MPPYVPQLATLVKAPPSGEGWWHEVKFDGYRIGCHIHNGRVTLISRNGNDWTTAYPEVAEAALALGTRDALIDGEVAALLPGGRTSFQALQQRGGAGGRAAIVYFVFDLLRIDGRSVESQPLSERKALLQKLVGTSATGRIRVSEHADGSGHAFLARACRLGLEGIVSKRVDRPYHHGRTTDWVKAKCIRRQEFVVGGFTDPEGTRAGLGALLIGYYDGARLAFAGKVGTGFTHAMAVDLRRTLEALQRRDGAFDPAPPRAIARRAHYVRPTLVCEVTFTEWTSDGMVRHPVFQGLRSDKQPTEVRIERATAMPAPAGAGADAGGTFGGIHVSQPEREVWSTPSITRLDLARYYERVARWLVPHVAGRPLTLLRRRPGSPERLATVPAPRRAPAPLHVAKVRVGTRAAARLVANDLASLVKLVDMNVLELHTAHVRSGNGDKPDRLVIELTAGHRVPWGRLVAAARHARSVLRALQLDSFCQTTGGHGLLVVVPLAPHAGWSECLAFSRALAHALVRTDPETLTTRAHDSARDRRILVDYRSNDRGRASIAVFSVRGLEGAPVSVPVAWDDLPSLTPAAFTIESVSAMMPRAKKDPWAGYWQSRQQLTKERLLAVQRVR